jgi:16S rRNA (uracil1498-N3)-methyltransferase
MPYFIIDKNFGVNDEISLEGDEATHVLFSHRARIGDELKIQNKNHLRFFAKILTIEKKTCKLKVLNELSSPQENSCQISLFVSYVSEKVLDIILQKATEFGVNKIILFNSHNTAVKLSKETFLKKSARWNKILTEAAKQSERAYWPSLEYRQDTNKILTDLNAVDLVCLADVSGGFNKNPQVKAASIALVVGPEGGFTEQEVESLKKLNNLKLVKLSNFVLRTETAAIGLLATTVSNINQ